MGERCIVIGGTAAGLSAASKAKRLKPDLELKVFEKSGYISYGACGLPYYVGGMISEAEELTAVSQETMREKRGIPTWTHHEVTGIDPKVKYVTVKNLETGETSRHDYDKLVIATGAVPVKLSVPGSKGSGIYYLRNVEDGIHLKSAVQGGGKRGEKRACIIGGGFIGLELAEQLTLSGVQVTIVEQLSRLLPFMEQSFSENILEHLKQHGVEVHLGSTVMRIENEKCTENENGLKSKKIVWLADNTAIDADFILVSAGVRPASDLAEAAGLELGLKGAIVVDERMQTSDPDIWACGDCVQMYHLLTKSPVYVPLGTTANKQGRVAGENLAGGKAEFDGVLGSMVTKVFERYISATGLTLEQAIAAGFHGVSSVITKGDRASYYPGGEVNQLCMILDQTTGKLLGAQGIGSESIAGRINVLAAAVTCGMTVEEISKLDLVYAPPVAPVYDPILIAASQAMKKLEKRGGK